MASVLTKRCKLTPSTAWLQIYQHQPKMNWYACKIDNIKAMRLKLKVISFGTGGLSQLTNFLSSKSMKTQIIFATILINEINNERQYKLINIQFIGTQVRFMTKTKITPQIDSIINEFPVRHLSIKLDETKLDLITQQSLTRKLNKFRGPYKVQYNFCCTTYNDNDNDLGLDFNKLSKENQELRLKINDLECKLLQKQQEMDLLIQNQQKIQFINNNNNNNDDSKESEDKDFCLQSFHLFMDQQIKVDKIKKSFLQNPNYNDIRMMEYLDADTLLNEIGINSKIFIKLILNKCKELMESQKEFTELIQNKKYCQLLNNKGIITLEHFNTFIKTENHLKHIIGIKNDKDRQQIWSKLINVINNGIIHESIEGQNTDYH